MDRTPEVFALSLHWSIQFVIVHQGAELTKDVVALRLPEKGQWNIFHLRITV